MENPRNETAGLLQRLKSLARPDGGLPYYPGGASATEPTLLVALALSASGSPAGEERPFLNWVRRIQDQDGSVVADGTHRRQGLWLTALAAIAFSHFRLETEAKRALDFVLSLRSVTAARNPRLKQDDTLPAWPWVPGTSGWVEPTAWSLIALKLAGLQEHTRAAEGVRFLLDRQIPSGGWNYGNPALDGRELLPFWDTTGLALVALRGLVESKNVAPSLDVLDRDQPKIDSLAGLAWAVLGLESHARDAARARLRLSAVMGSVRDEELHAGNYALGLIALAGKKVFWP